MTQDTLEDQCETPSNEQTSARSDETDGQREAESPTGRISLRFSFDVDWSFRGASADIGWDCWRGKAGYIKKLATVFKSALPCAHRVCETVYYLVMIAGYLAMLLGMRAAMEGPPM